MVSDYRRTNTQDFCQVCQCHHARQMHSLARELAEKVSIGDNLHHAVRGNLLYQHISMSRAIVTHLEDQGLPILEWLVPVPNTLILYLSSSNATAPA